MKRVFGVSPHLHLFSESLSQTHFDVKIKKCNGFISKKDKKAFLKSSGSASSARKLLFPRPTRGRFYTLLYEELSVYRKSEKMQWNREGKDDVKLFLTSDGCRYLSIFTLLWGMFSQKISVTSSHGSLYPYRSKEVSIDTEDVVRY